MKLIYKHGELNHGKIITYPDGQHNVVLDMSYFNQPKEPVVIKCSIRNFIELEILLCCVAALKSADLLIGRIEFVYLFGLRSDRKFEDGSCNYVEHVLAPIIKRLDSECIWPCKILQPHGRSTKYFNRDYGHQSFYHIQLPDDFKHCIKVAGDESAKDIVSSMGEYWHKDPLHFVKSRTNGDIVLSMCLNHQREIMEYDLPILIIDDLCDGGATFIAEAQYLKDTGLLGDRKLYLFVYHGLFTAGFEKIFGHFDRIYTTNSYQSEFLRPTIDYDKLKIIDVWGN